MLDQKWTHLEFRGGVFYIGSKMNSFGIGGGRGEGGVFYVGSKMNSFGILGGGSFTLDQKWTHLEFGGGG